MSAEQINRARQSDGITRSEGITAMRRPTKFPRWPGSLVTGDWSRAAGLPPVPRSMTSAVPTFCAYSPMRERPPEADGAAAPPNARRGGL